MFGQFENDNLENSVSERTAIEEIRTRILIALKENMNSAVQYKAGTACTCPKGTFQRDGKCLKLMRCPSGFRPFGGRWVRIRTGDIQLDRRRKGGIPILRQNRI